MTIGEVKAASNPLWLGLSEMAFAWRATWDCRPAIHWSAVRFVGRPKAEERSASGSSIDGRVLKNSTPAEKSLSVSPVVGSSRTPPGTSTLMKTCNGPSSESPIRIVRPAIPAMEKPPEMPR